MRTLHSARLPAPAPEDERAYDGERREGNGDGEENSARPQPEMQGQRVGERNLPEPEDEEVDDGRRARVARAVEALRDDHAVRVEEEAARDDTQAVFAVGVNLRPRGRVREEADDGVCEDDEDQADGPEEDHVVEGREPHGLLRALGLARAERLADERRRRVRHAPRRQQREHDDAQADGVSGDGRAPEVREYAHQPDPARHAYEDLKGRIPRESDEPRHDLRVKTHVPPFEPY